MEYRPILEDLQSFKWTEHTKWYPGWWINEQFVQLTIGGISYMTQAYLIYSSVGYISHTDRTHNYIAHCCERDWFPSSQALQSADAGMDYGSAAFPSPSYALSFSSRLDGGLASFYLARMGARLLWPASYSFQPVAEVDPFAPTGTCTRTPHTVMCTLAVHVIRYCHHRWRATSTTAAESHPISNWHLSCILFQHQERGVNHPGENSGVGMVMVEVVFQLPAVWMNQH